MQNMCYLHRVDAIIFHEDTFMPIYEYTCNDCRTRFEVISTSSNETKEVQCSKCHSSNVSKMISAGSFRLGSTSSAVSASSTGCGGKSGFS